jgi:hypothetical protein
MPLNRRLTLSIAVIFGGLLLLSLSVAATRQQQVQNIAATINTRRETTTPVVQDGLLFPAVQPTDVTSITVRDGQTGRAITLVKEPGNWRATDEKGAAVALSDERLANLSRVVTIIGTLPYNRVIIDQNLSSYGLAGDTGLTIQFEAGTTHRLKIGTIAQVSGLTYVLRDNDNSTIYLVPTQSLEVLSGLLAGVPP